MGNALKYALIALPAGLLLFVLSYCGSSRLTSFEQINGQLTYCQYADGLAVIVEGDPMGDNRVVVPATIEKWAVENDIVFGRIAPFPPQAHEGPDATTYFYLKFNSPQPVLNLEHHQWMSAMNKLGIRHADKKIMGLE